MVLYCIPNLLNHLQAYTKPDLNPSYDFLKVKYPGWNDPQRLLSDAHHKAWEVTDIALITSRFFPEADLEGADIGMKYVIFSLIIEISTDAPVSTVEAQYWADIYRQAIHQRLGETEGITSFINYTDQMLEVINKEPYLPYIIEQLNLLTEGMANEAVSREHAYTNLEEYMKTRRNSVGVRPMFDIGRLIYGIDIGHQVLTHPDINKIEEEALDLTCLTNDLYSYKKECLAGGAYHNYITIALRDPVTGLHENDHQGAIDYTYQKFCEILADLEHRKKMLPSFGKSEDAKVARYMEMLMDMVVGNIQYSLKCRRYGHCRTPEEPHWGDVVFDMDSPSA